MYSTLVGSFSFVTVVIERYNNTITDRVCDRLIWLQSWLLQLSALLLITSSFEVEFFFSTKIEKNQENHLPQINKYDILVLVVQ
jgi:hypothetical protein